MVTAPAVPQGVSDPQYALPQWLAQLLLVIVGALVGLVWRWLAVQRHEDLTGLKAQRDADMAALERHRQEDRRLIDREISVLETAIKSSQGESATLCAELWEEIKDSRIERRRSDEEFWKKVNVLAEQHAAFQLVLIRDYATKKELSDMLVDKLAPLSDSIKELKTIINNRDTP